MGRSKDKGVLYFPLSALSSDDSGYETLKLNKVQLCVQRSHFCQQHHMECVNTPGTVSNIIQLCISFPFHFEVFCINKLCM